MPTLALPLWECQRGVPPARSDRIDGVDLDAFRWLLTDDGHALLARPRRSPRRRRAGRPADAAPAGVRRPGRGRADPGRAAAARAGRSSATWPRGCTSPPTASSRPPGSPSPGTGPRGSRRRRPRPWSTSAAASAATCVAAAAAGLTAAGVDLDPLRVAVAEANLAALGLPGAVMVADATTLDIDALRRRVRRPGPALGPRPHLVGATTGRRRGRSSSELLRRDACVKVAPGIPHDLVPDGVEAEWVSDHGEVKEAALWSGRLATDRAARDRDRRRRAGHADRRGRPGRRRPRRRRLPLRARRRGDPGRAWSPRSPPASTAGCVDEHIAYVTSDASYRTPFARGYRVLEQLPYREKQLKAALRERGIGMLTIKKRGRLGRPGRAAPAARAARRPDRHAGAHPGRRPRHGAAGRAVLSRVTRRSGSRAARRRRRGPGADRARWPRPVSTSTRAVIAPGVVPYVAIRTGASEPAEDVRRVRGDRDLPGDRPVAVAGERHAGGAGEPTVLGGLPVGQRAAPALLGRCASGRAAAGSRAADSRRPRSGRSRPEARRAGAERGTSTSTPAARAAPPKAATASASPLATTAPSTRAPRHGPEATVTAAADRARDAPRAAPTGAPASLRACSSRATWRAADCSSRVRDRSPERTARTIAAARGGRVGRHQQHVVAGGQRPDGDARRRCGRP